MLMLMVEIVSAILERLMMIIILLFSWGRFIVVSNQAISSVLELELENGLFDMIIEDLCNYHVIKTIDKE